MALIFGVVLVSTACTLSPERADLTVDTVSRPDDPGAGPASDRSAPLERGRPAAGAESATLDRLIDGDSMELLVDGSPVEVRLLGINAPELETLGGGASCAGAGARQAMDELLTAGPLALTGAENDRFGRLLAQLHAGDVDVNRSMVAQGWALGLWSADDTELVSLMREAAAAGAGMWGDLVCGPAPAPITIADAQVDPPGPDEDRLGEEWVEIVNGGSEPVDLDGWSIADETTSNRFALPAQVLDPGAVLRVVTGAGPDGPDRFHLDHDDPVWSNRGETILVVDPEGRIAGYRFES